MSAALAQSDLGVSRSNEALMIGHNSERGPDDLVR